MLSRYLCAFTQYGSVLQMLHQGEKGGHMSATLQIKAVDRVDILTLQDNTIDLVQQDNSAVVQRAMPLVGLEVKNSIQAEHGFSSMITVTDGDRATVHAFRFRFFRTGGGL
jgi:7,8-dihydropterin-6-yl-methyl-4-(beta-D-ribofuranosyl)aminobenzene 5'-phosphate synthase